MSDKQIAELNKASQKKKQEALLKTQAAIAELTQNNQKITIRSVARKAGVSVSYIYKYPELAYEIQRLREQQKYSLVKCDRPNESTTTQVKILQQNKAELVREINDLRAIIDRVKTGINSLEDFQLENIKLKLENQRLKRELEYTQKNLQETREFILKTGYIDQDQIKTENNI
jgi:hypothetical protein